MCELTILFPCLNEAETLAACIRKAGAFLAEADVDGEILVADNGSTDGSDGIAVREGARLIRVKEPGYGSTLRAGSQQARGRYVIMADSDDSYDVRHLRPFLDRLREGYDLVMGNRYAGGIDKDAMPALHRYIGVPFLSAVGRLLYGSRIGDFHCGLRGYDRDAINALGLTSTGMEYASEMIIKSEMAGLRITEVPTTLRKDGRSGRSHIRTFPDGWRHLRLLIKNAPIAGKKRR